MKKIPLILFSIAIAIIQPAVSLAQESSDVCTDIWTTLDDETGDFQARHEADYLRIGDLFYLVGGRGNRSLAIYNPKTAVWSTGTPPPREIHHFQAVTVDQELWIVGAFSDGAFPNEKPLDTILIYNPVNDTWRNGPLIARPRGGGGVIVRGRKLYLICGITNGHVSGHVAWFDEYDIDTGIWTQMPDAPRARDHYRAVLINNTIWNAAGRRSARNSAQGVFGNTVSEVDYYDFTSKKWNTLPSTGNIPTPRAGNAAINFHNKLIVAGGESNTQSAAHNEVESLDPILGLWSSLPSLQRGRHGAGLAIYDDCLYIASGAPNQGGSNELSTQERYCPCSEHSDSDTSGTAPAITNISRNGTVVSIQFQGRQGGTYTLKKSTSIDDKFINSSPAPGNIHTLTSGTIGILNDIQANEQDAFYRVEEVSNAAPLIEFNSNGTITDNGAVVGTYTLTGPSSLGTFDTTTGIMVQAGGNTFNGAGATVSLTIDSLIAGYDVVGPITVSSTSLVSGVFNNNSRLPGGGGGFAIGNSSASAAFSFNVNGQFTTGPSASFIYDAGGDITTDGALAAGETAIADNVGEYLDDTFLFTPDQVLGVGSTLSVTLGSFGGNSIAGEAFLFRVNIAPITSDN